MANEVIRDVADADLQTAIDDLEFEGFEIVDKEKGRNGLWTLNIRKKGVADAPQPSPGPAPEPEPSPGPSPEPSPSPSPVGDGGISAGLIPDAWMPKCKMERIICHWTAGAYKASAHDRECYHILIEKDGTLVRGHFSIADNVTAADNIYARHTQGCNSGSIGITVCCMAEANESPFRPGSCPMTREQWEVLAKVAAQLAKRYRIPVTPQTILGHGEVEEILGKPQKQKWDPMVLPWDLKVPKDEVGRRFRARVKELLAMI
jgi:N-acetylmuramoyl-L-alanine amidase